MSIFYSLKKTVFKNTVITYEIIQRKLDKNVTFDYVITSFKLSNLNGDQNFPVFLIYRDIFSIC